jgi:hypothetical protein
MDSIMKKKNKNLGPRRKRMDRRSRLQSATEWIKKYEGKNIIASYAKWFGVDKICAMTELEMLGLTYSDKRKTQIKMAEENRKHQMNVLKEKRNKKNNSNNEEIESDEFFAYIAGYTDSGVPFGITQGEIEEVECGPNKKEKLLLKSNIVVGNDNLPF